MHAYSPRIPPPSSSFSSTFVTRIPLLLFEDAEHVSREGITSSARRKRVPIESGRLISGRYHGHLGPFATH